MTILPSTATAGGGHVAAAHLGHVCMNLLKLPPYGSLEALRDKFTYAIEAGAGFELT